jgi:spermidine synthase
VDTPVHPLCRHYGLFVRVHFGGIPELDLSGIVVLPVLEPEAFSRKSAGTKMGLGMVGMVGIAATVFRRSPDIHVDNCQGGVRSCAILTLLGFLTPMLVDRWAGGDPDRAGRAYALNVVGCIIGPLLAGFVLLPLFGERWSLLILALPWVAGALVPGQEPAGSATMRRRLATLAVVPLTLGLVITTHGFEDQFGHREILRDNTATIIAVGEGMERHLLVNGIGITFLTPMTKVMVHLPLAFLNHPPRNALVVCFGMGTTYRSMLSWGIPTTVVELVPSVPKLFWYYHADGPQLLKSKLSRVVIDDGRRYLERSPEQYDVIALDPPPPVEAAGSSLLYSKEFYATVRTRLRPDGILQQWLPRGDPAVHAAVARALQESFPYVRAFHSIGIGESIFWRAVNLCETGAPKNWCNTCRLRRRRT